MHNLYFRHHYIRWQNDDLPKHGKRTIHSAPQNIRKVLFCFVSLWLCFPSFVGMRAINPLHSAWIRRLGVRVPLKSRHFLPQKLWHFHKNTRSCVENECCCPCTVKISNVNFTSNISTPPEPVFKNMRQQIFGRDSSISYNIRHESEGWGFETPQVQTFSVSKTFTLSQEHPFVCRK